MKHPFFSLILIASALASGVASAQLRKLECTTGRDFEKFSATLDDSAYDAGSGIFAITQAAFLDNYLSIQLNCAGYSLDTLDCIGFAFGSSGHVGEVTLVQRDGAYYAQLTTLKGSTLPMHDGPWPCAIQE